MKSIPRNRFGDICYRKINFKVNKIKIQFKFSVLEILIQKLYFSIARDGSKSGRLDSVTQSLVSITDEYADNSLLKGFHEFTEKLTDQGMGSKYVKRSSKVI